jgi:integrase/recombinase XerD
MPRVAAGSPRQILAFANWPAADQDMWHALVEQGASILDDSGFGARWSPHSCQMRQQSYGAWLSCIERHFPDRLSLPPHERITPETVRAWLAEMEELLAPYTRRLRVMDLTTIVNATAPHADWTFLRRVLRRLEQGAVSVRGKDIRVRPTAELVALGSRLMDAAGHAGSVRQAALQFRDGLIIAALALRPLRMRNFSALEMGRTLVPIGNGHLMVFPAAETKTRRAIEVAWPATLEPALRTYLDIHRPYLLGGHARAGLWITPHLHAVMTQHSIKLMICKRTRDALGVSLNPNLFRDCAATTVAIEDPENIGIAACLLGHINGRTTQRYYNQANSLQASGAFLDVLEQLRATLRPESRCAHVTHLTEKLVVTGGRVARLGRGTPGMHAQASLPFESC